MRPLPAYFPCFDSRSPLSLQITLYWMGSAKVYQLCLVIFCEDCLRIYIHALRYQTFEFYLLQHFHLFNTCLHLFSHKVNVTSRISEYACKCVLKYFKKRERKKKEIKMISFKWEFVSISSSGIGFVLDLLT